MNDLIHEGMDNLSSTGFDCREKKIDRVTGTSFEFVHRDRGFFVLSMADSGPYFVSAGRNLEFDVVEGLSTTGIDHDSPGILVEVLFDSPSGASGDRSPCQIRVSSEGEGCVWAMLLRGDDQESVDDLNIYALEEGFHLGVDFSKGQCWSGKGQGLDWVGTYSERQCFSSLVGGDGECGNTLDESRFSVFLFELIDDLRVAVYQVSASAGLDYKIGPPAVGEKVTFVVSQPNFDVCCTHKRLLLLGLMNHLRSSGKYVKNF